MVQAKQVTNLMREGSFEIVRAWRAVSRKLQLSPIVRPWSRIDAYVCFGDVPCFRIEEDARASGSRCGVERFVFSSGGNCQQADSVACFCRTNRSGLRPGDGKVDIRQAGPASERSPGRADHITIGFDVCAGRKQRGG